MTHLPMRTYARSHDALIHPNANSVATSGPRTSKSRTDRSGKRKPYLWGESSNGRQFGGRERDPVRADQSPAPAPPWWVLGIMSSGLSTILRARCA